MFPGRLGRQHPGIRTRCPAQRMAGKAVRGWLADLEAPPGSGRRVTRSTGRPTDLATASSSSSLRAWSARGSGRSGSGRWRGSVRERGRSAPGVDDIASMPRCCPVSGRPSEFLRAGGHYSTWARHRPACSFRLRCLPTSFDAVADAIVIEEPVRGGPGLRAGGEVAVAARCAGYGSPARSSTRRTARPCACRA